MARRLAGRCGYPEAPHHFDVTLHPDRLDEPLRRKKPTTYFVCSMSDLFHEDVPDRFIVDVFRTIDITPEHIYQVLTKRPRRIYDLMVRGWLMAPLPDNVWLGVTAENQETADERIPLLRQTPAAVRFVSCEPLLGPIDLCRAGAIPSEEWWVWSNAINWCIVGGESGPGARPMHPQWARDIRDQCQAAGVPFFFKQWGAWLPLASADEASHYPNAQLHEFEDGTWSVRVSKKQAGHLLDGEEWREFPHYESPQR